MNTDTITQTSPAPVEPLKPWLNAAYGRITSLTGKYPNLQFRESGEARANQIAGWLAGLVHGGRRDLAEKVAADITAQFEYLNGYGGDIQDLTYQDGTPVLKVPRYIVELGDDGTFGGFALRWYRAVREGSEQDGDRTEFLRTRWDDLMIHRRWGPQGVEPREIVSHFFSPVMNGGLLYHGPGGGETFSVAIGDTRFWSIHT